MRRLLSSCIDDDRESSFYIQRRYQALANEVRVQVAALSMTRTESVGHKKVFLATAHVKPYSPTRGVFRDNAEAKGW